MEPYEMASLGAEHHRQQHRQHLGGVADPNQKSPLETAQCGGGMGLEYKAPPSEYEKAALEWSRAKDRALEAAAQARKMAADAEAAAMKEEEAWQRVCQARLPQPQLPTGVLHRPQAY